MIDDLSIHVFQNTYKKIVNGSTPLANDKSVPKSPLLSSAKPKTKRSSKKFGTNSAIQFFNKHSKNEVLSKPSKSEYHILSVDLEDKIATKNGVPPCNDLLNQGEAEQNRNVGKENSHFRSKEIKIKGNLKTGLDAATICNEQSYRLSARRCLFNDSLKTLTILDKAMEKNSVGFQSGVTMNSYNSKAQHCEHFNVIAAPNSPCSPVLSPNKWKNKNDTTFNKTFNSILKSKESYVNQFGNNGIQNVGSVGEERNTTEKISHTNNGNTSSDIYSNNFCHKERYKPDHTFKNSKKYKNYYCFDGSINYNNNCSKMKVQRCKIEKRHFEPISDDEQEEFIIEQFLSQTEVTNEIPVPKKNPSPSKTLNYKKAINFENFQANNHSKTKHLSSLDMQSETDHFDINSNFNNRIKGNYTSEININTRGSKERFKKTIARPGIKVGSNIKQNTSSSQVLKFKTKSKLSDQKSLSEFNVEEKEMHSSKATLPVIDHYSAVHIDKKSLILSEKRSQNQNCKEILDFGYDNTNTTSPILSGKRSQNQNCKEILDFGYDNTNTTSPILSGKRSQNQNCKEILDFGYDNTNTTSPILSGKRSQNQSIKEILDPCFDDKTNSPILSEKRSQSQSIRYNQNSLTFENNNIAISLSLNNCKNESLIASGTENESIDLFSTQSHNMTQKACLSLKMQTNFVSQKRHYTQEYLTTDSPSQFKVLKSDENTIIEEYPTQLTFIEQPTKTLKKFKSHDGFYISETTFYNSNVSHNFSNKGKELEIEKSELNSKNSTPTNNDFISKTELKLMNELAYTSVVLNRSMSESNDIIEDFVSQEKSDNVSTEDVIETQSSPLSNSQASEHLQSVPVKSNNRLNEKVNDIPLDSPEKKHRKPKPGSLSQRMKRLLHFQHSKFCMWKHNRETNVTNNSSTLRVNKIWNEFGKVIIDCCQNITSFGTEKAITGEVHANILAIVEPGAANDVSENCIISIHPPWQSMIFEEINLVVVLNVTRLEIITRFSNSVQPPTSKIENKTFSCLCIGNGDTETNHCNFSLPLRGMELISSWFKVSELNNPKFFQAGERSVAAAVTNSFLTTQFTLELSVLHQFRCIDKAGRESLNAMAVDKNGECCQIALTTPMDETIGVTKGDPR